MSLAQKAGNATNNRAWFAELNRLLEQDEMGRDLRQRHESQWMKFCADGLSPEEAILAQRY
jgi:hypothetical protein